MGAHESKIDHQNDGIKPKIPPILSRKLESMKRRRSESTLSNERLLIKDGLEDDRSSNERKSSAVPSGEPDDDILAGSAKVAPIESSTVSDNVIDKEASSAMEKLTLRGKKDRPVSLVCPGSPSFRLYLTETETEKQLGKEELMVKESLSDSDVDVAKDIVESQTSTEELGSNIKRRRRRGMRLRRMIPNGRPVKNFLKVRSCYYPSCVGHKMNDQPLITQTPASL